MFEFAAIIARIVIVIIINLNIRKNVYVVFNNFLILDSFFSKDNIIVFEFAAIITRIVIINLNIRRNVCR